MRSCSRSHMALPLDRRRRRRSPATISLEAMRSSHPAASLQRVLPHSSGMAAAGLQGARVQSERSSTSGAAGSCGRGCQGGAAVVQISEEC